MNRRALSSTLALTAVDYHGGGWVIASKEVYDGGARGLAKQAQEWFANTLCKAEDKKDPRIDLVHANLNGLPPVTLINAQIDPLRSDGDMLAEGLKKAGVKVEHKMYPGTAHEFFGMAAVVASAKDAQALAGRNLKQAFKGKGETRPVWATGVESASPS